MAKAVDIIRTICRDDISVELGVIEPQGGSPESYLIGFFLNPIRVLKGTLKDNTAYLYSYFEQLSLTADVEIEVEDEYDSVVFLYEIK